MISRWAFVILIITGSLLFLLEYDIVALVFIVSGLIGSIYYFIKEGFLGNVEGTEEIPEDFSFE